jgi:hypothetical protein
MVALAGNRGGSMAKTTSFTLSGKTVRVTADPDRRLAWVLRYNLGRRGAQVRIVAAVEAAGKEMGGAL